MRLRHARSQSDGRQPVSSLALSLVCYSVAMVLDTFVLGSTIRVDTHSLRAEVGTHAVVYSVDSKQPNNKAAVWIMPDEEAASTLVAHVLAVDDGGSEGDENVLLLHGHALTCLPKRGSSEPPPRDSGVV